MKMTEQYHRCINKLKEFMEKYESSRENLEILEIEFTGNGDFIKVCFSDGSTKRIERSKFPECDGILSS